MDLLQDGAGGVEKGKLSDKANGFRHEEFIDFGVVLDQTVLKMTLENARGRRRN